MWQSSKAYPLAYCPPGRGVTLSYIPRALPQLLRVVPSRHRSACGILFSTTDLTDRTNSILRGKRIDQKVCCFPWAYALTARCVCSAMKASFPGLTIPTRLVCPQADSKSHKTK